MSKWATVGVVALVLVVGIGWIAYDNFFRFEAPRYESIEALMKYGSVGQEDSAGLPYRVWRVMPAVCSEQMPAGFDPQRPYSAFGFVYEDGHEVPIGVTKKRIGFERMSLSCAACHNSHYREHPQDEPTYYLSGTDISFDGQRYFNFLFACAKSSDFTPDKVTAAVDEDGGLGPVKRLIYRYLIIPIMRKELLETEKRLDWWYDIPEPGPGRWIAFNDLKYHFAKQPRDGSIGNPDVPTLFNLQIREDIKTYHWDGLTDTVDKAMQNAAVGAGATETNTYSAELNRLRDWWLVQPAPKYPMPIDADLAAQGKTVWEATCSHCHQVGVPTAGRIHPIDEIGTDRHRYDLITPGTVEGYNRMAKETYGWPQEWFIRKMDGYLAPLLDAVWLRAPYLHNGSVPTIADLLEPPENRPKVFYRGYDLYDQERLGFVSSGPEAEKHFRYDTSLPGNGNDGHLHGTGLEPGQKRALIEYLKTL